MKKYCLFGVILIASQAINCSPSKKLAVKSDSPQNVSVQTAGTGGENESTHARTDEFLNSLLIQHPEFFDTIIQNRRAWNVQVIYTQIDRNAQNDPQFIDYYWNVDKDAYFYPASTVKMPVAILALQKLKELKINGLDKKSTMITESAYSGQTPVYNDPTTPDGKPNVEQYIKKIFLVSDNDAFNRLYEFLGPAAINDKLHRMGYEDIQIRQRLQMPLSEDENRHTNPIKFLDANGKLLYSQQPEFDETNYAARNNKLGKAFYNSGKLVNEPMDFSIKNRISLEDLHQILKSIYFPKSVPSRKRFDLYPEDYRLVYQSMSQYPPESRFPSYDTTEFYDTYCKYFLFGSDRGVKPDAGLRIFNKVGDAYGFLLDVAYIVDFEHKVEFMLSAIIYCNRDEVLNDDKYDFDSIGYPFFRNLGKTIYDYELKRTREHAPDLTSLLFDYSKQP